MKINWRSAFVALAVMVGIILFAVGHIALLISPYGWVAPIPYVAMALGIMIHVLYQALNLDGKQQ